MVLVFFCAICHEDYSSSEEISATRCGHVFHHRCIVDWFTRSATCPDCRSDSSSGDLQKIYITSRSAEHQDLSEINTKLKSQLEQSVANLSQIQHMLDESEQNFFQLQKQLENVENEREVLLSEKERFETLTESLGIELEAQKIDIRHMREEFDTINNNQLKENSNTNANQQLAEKDRLIEDLKRQLGEKTLELQKEVRNSTMLIVEKAKLQQSVDESMRCLTNISGNPSASPSYGASDVYAKYPSPKNQYNQSPKTQYNTKDVLRNLESHIGKYEMKNARHSFGGTGRGAVRKNSHGRLDNARFSVFQHAKKLEKVGFQRVFYEDNEIFAKMNNYPDIQITSMGQVDTLLKKFDALKSDLSSRLASAIGSVTNSGDCGAGAKTGAGSPAAVNGCGYKKSACDEQFYDVLSD